VLTGSELDLEKIRLKMFIAETANGMPMSGGNRAVCGFRPLDRRGSAASLQIAFFVLCAPRLTTL
jgi:hypothetical protein